MLWFAQGSTNSRKHFAAIIALEIASRKARVAALQKRWDRLRSGLELILDERGADMVDVPGGASGLLCAIRSLREIHHIGLRLMYPTRMHFRDLKVWNWQTYWRSLGSAWK